MGTECALVLCLWTHSPECLNLGNFLNKKTDKHFFSNIYKERTTLNPNYLIEEMSNEYKIPLYTGGWGMGYYIDVDYFIKEQKYVYYAHEGGTTLTELFKSDNWKEFSEYVRKDLLDMFIHFNEN